MMKANANAKHLKGHEAEPGFQAAVPHHPSRLRAPKRAMKARANIRIKKGPLESKG